MYVTGFSDDFLCYDSKLTLERRKRFPKASRIYSSSWPMEDILLHHTRIPPKRRSGPRRESDWIGSFLISLRKYFRSPERGRRRGQLWAHLSQSQTRPATIEATNKLTHLPLQFLQIPNQWRSKARWTKRISISWDDLFFSSFFLYP